MGATASRGPGADEGSNAGSSSSTPTPADGGDPLISHKRREDSLLIDFSKPPPWIVWDVMTGLKAPPPAPVRVLHVLEGFMQTQVLYTAVRLGIADHLAQRPMTKTQVLYMAVRLGIADHVAQRPMTKDELAAAVGGGVPERVERLMSALIAIGLFELVPSSRAENKGEARYVNNACSATLRTDHPNTMAPLVAHWVEDSYNVWSHLPSAVVEGGTVFTSKRMQGGKDIWAYYKDNPRQSEQFDNAMTSVDALGAWAMVLDGPFAKSQRIHDIGGGRGHFLAKILRTYGHLKGTVTDLANVISQSTLPAWTTGEFADLKDRVEVREGSFFEADTLPKALDGDAYLLRLVLHDWDDESCLRILASLHTAMCTPPPTTHTHTDAHTDTPITDTPPPPPTTHTTHTCAKSVRLLICDMVLPDRDQAVEHNTFKYLLDLQMCVLLGAKERSRSEWAALLRSAGFTLVAIHPTRSFMHVIEAQPSPSPPPMETQESATLLT